MIREQMKELLKMVDQKKLVRMTKADHPVDALKEIILKGKLELVLTIQGGKV